MKRWTHGPWDIAKGDFYTMDGDSHLQATAKHPGHDECRVNAKLANMTAEMADAILAWDTDHCTQDLARLKGIANKLRQIMEAGK